MSLAGNISISVRKEAFSDVAPKKKTIIKFIIGIGNGYTIIDKNTRYIKLFFENNANQITKNLSYTKPINSNKSEALVSGIKEIINSGNYNVSKNLVFDIDGFSPKDKKDIKNLITKFK